MHLMDKKQIELAPQTDFYAQETLQSVASVRTVATRFCRRCLVPQYLRN
jgi:hypothetical protein